MDVTAWAVRGTVALSLLPPNPHSAGRPPRVRPWAAYGRQPSARTHDLRRPASVTLHHLGRQDSDRRCSKADIRSTALMRLDAPDHVEARGRAIVEPKFGQPYADERQC